MGKYCQPDIDGSPVLTTHTEHVNKYPSVLQTRSYNFTVTAIEVLCTGIVNRTLLDAA